MDKSHKGGRPVDPTPQRPSARHREDLALGSSQPPPKNETHEIEAEIGIPDPSGTRQHNTVIQQSMQDRHKRLFHTLHKARHEMGPVTVVYWATMEKRDPEFQAYVMGLAVIVLEIVRQTWPSTFTLLLADRKTHSKAHTSHPSPRSTWQTGKTHSEVHTSHPPSHSTRQTGKQRRYIQRDQDPLHTHVRKSRQARCLAPVTQSAVNQTFI